MSTEPFVGQISMVGFNFAPVGWATCDGQILSISQNTALFALLGTAFGGDGIQTFALPDLRSRVPLHQGQGPGLGSYVIGEKAGVENVTLTTPQLPQHNHTVSPPDNNGPLSTTVFNPTNAYEGAQSSSGATAPFAAAAVSGVIMAQFPTGASGNSLPHANVEPYLCINFIIALEGIFPSRN
jgi:microcystin-dependent protein